MEAFLIEWGTEIILSLVIAMLTYYFKRDAKEKEEERREYQRLLEEYINLQRQQNYLSKNQKKNIQKKFCQSYTRILLKEIKKKLIKMQ